MNAPHSLPTLDALDHWWRERPLGAPLDEREAASQGLLQFPSALAADEYEWRWKVARWLHFAAMQAVETGDKPNARRLFECGGAAAGVAARLHPTRVEGRFWRGVCALEGARLKGSVAALLALPGAEKDVEAAMKMDEAFHFAGPLRVMGRITHLKPLALGGNLDNAIALHRRALQVCPDNSTSLLYLAQSLFADRQPAEAKRALRTLLAAPDDPSWTWEQARDRRHAAKLMEENS